jgi:predicted RNA-binding protein with PIN domain
MILIIDGYNLLKFVHGAQTVTEHQRAAFVQQLTQYTRHRSLKPILIFDGGDARWPSHTSHGIVTVTYAGSHETADAYIQRYIAQHKNKKLLLVSSDRELAQYANDHLVPSIDAPFFWHILQYVQLQHKQSAKQKAAGQTIKLSHEDNPALDAQMYAINAVHHKELPDEMLSHLDQHRQPSKIDAQLRILLKKLL